MSDTEYEIPGTCPACGHEMHALVLHCDNCGTEVRGDFILGRFARLDPDQLSFLETFISCRGNLKDVGAKLNMSYPTTRARLDSLLVALGYADAVPDGAEEDASAPAPHRGRAKRS
ncbi:MAG: DUF2089 domain-containing protein [Coriobacteriales bacterium]|jgi:hypothetical protein